MAVARQGRGHSTCQLRREFKMKIKRNTKIPNPKPKSRNPKPEIRERVVCQGRVVCQDPKPEIRNPKPKIRNPKSQIRIVPYCSVLFRSVLYCSVLFRTVQSCCIN